MIGELRLKHQDNAIGIRNSLPCLCLSGTINWTMRVCLPLRLMTAELHLVTKQDNAKNQRNNMANANRNVHFLREEKTGLILSLLKETDIIKYTHGRKMHFKRNLFERVAQQMQGTGWVWVEHNKDDLSICSSCWVAVWTKETPLAIEVEAGGCITFSMPLTIMCYMYSVKKRVGRGRQDKKKRKAAKSQGKRKPKKRLSGLLQKMAAGKAYHFALTRTLQYPPHWAEEDKTSS